VNRNRPTGSEDRLRLAEILLRDGAISPSQLDQAMALQATRVERIGELLCELGYVNRDTLHAALSEQRGIEQVALDERAIDTEALGAISPELAFRHKVLPFATRNGALSVAMADPFDRAATDCVRVISGKRVNRYYCPEAQLLEATRRAYGSNVARMIADLDSAADSADDSDINEQQLANHLAQMAREPSVVNLVSLMIFEAIEGRASDIHIEPFEQLLKVKYRIDGVLHEMSPPPKRLQQAIVSRIKIMAGMNIAERFVPQDGHITVDGPQGKVDIRVSTVPTVFGESLVMRLLDRSTGLIDLEHLGLTEHCRETFCMLLERPHGIVLVTGPTGSGKTTTLYAAVKRIYSPRQKIITVEDPVEYQLEGVNQIPVNPKRGLGFANGLRAILRQDPDVIMVGEIRDVETAEIAIRSALTGHLVFSTLHTNDAAGAVTRLIDMGVEAFLLASSLEGVLAQRLVRTICRHCGQADTPTPQVLHRMGHQPDNGEDVRFRRGRGCEHCRQTGYRGRVGIFEMLSITEPVRRAVMHDPTSSDIKQAAGSNFEPMIEDGYRKAAAGVTTLEEVLRVTQDTRDAAVSI
jgi:type II secretion system protein E